MSDTTDTSRTSSGSIKDITVYLTGFGAFARISDNPSSQISASFLPVGSTTVTTAAPDGVKYNIHLHPHPEPLKVSYKAVDEAVEKIWKYGSWDYILHLGVGLKGPFKLETVAYEKGYKYADVDGVDADGKKGLGKAEEKEEERGEGEMFATTLDVGYLVDFVKDYVASSRQPRTLVLAAVADGLV